MADIASLVKALKDKAVAQYEKGAPYRQALVSALRGDAQGINQALSKSDLTPMDFALMMGTSGIGGKLPKTEFELAHELAQQRAALPVSEGGLGLPANNTAMDRAKAMGFDTEKTWYHGTPYDFNEFSRTKDIGYHFGDKWQANDRARIGGSNVMPVHLKTENTINTNDVYGTNSNWQIPNEVRDSGYVTENELSKLWKENIPARHNEAFSDLLKQKGIDSIQYDNMVEGIPTSLRHNGEQNISTIVLSPNQVRSKFAAFDPFKRNDADILAGIGVALPFVDYSKDKK